MRELVPALIVYLWAGWCMAECGASGSRKYASTVGKMLAYGTLFLAWPLLMPWVPRYIEKQRNK